MIKNYDAVRIIKSGKLGHVVEIDDANGKKPPLYLVELDDKPEGSTLSDVLVWCDWREIEIIE